MPYVTDRPLESLFDRRPLERARARTVRRVGDDLKEGVRRRTPVAKMPEGVPAAGDSRADWIKARGGRLPGTLRESWEVERIGEDSVEVFTLDPVAEHVEWDTVPHLIRARRARFLRYWDDVGKVFRREVHHPGTTGAHMMRDALAALEVEWQRVGEDEMARWAREAA